MMNGWNGYTLNYMLLHVVKPMASVQKIENLADDFYAISEIMKVAGAHKMVDTYYHALSLSPQASRKELKN